MTVHFHNLAIKNKMILFCLLPLSTHLTQPLDVAALQVDAMNKPVRLGDEKFDKFEFLAAFQSFRNQTFKQTTIFHAFKSTRLVPFILLEKIREEQAQRTQSAL